MSDTSRNNVRLALIAVAAFVFLLPKGAFSQVWQPCQVPPQIAFSSSPNLLILHDMSGSMQLQTYYTYPSSYNNGNWTYGNSQVLDEDDTYPPAGSKMSAVYASAYDPTNNPNSTTDPYYYGLFDNNQYYLYDNGSQSPSPSKVPGGGCFYPIGTAPTSGSANNIGTVATGLSGAVLNWAVTCRTDAALQALIGGKAYDSTDTNAIGYVGNTTTQVNCTDSSSMCYKKAQGARRRVIETSNLNADIYIRPATWTQTVPAGLNVDYPNDYSSASGTQTDPSYPMKDLVISVRGQYTGTLATTSPYTTSGSGKSQTKTYYEVWQFTLTQTTNVDIELTGSWTSGTSNSQLLVSTTAPPSSPSGGTVTCTSGCSTNTGNPATVQLQLAGSTSGTTYYVYAFAGQAGQIGGYTISSNVPLSPYSTTFKPSPTPFTIGSIPYARVRIAIAPTDLDQQGVVRTSWSQGQFGYMYYKNDTSSHMGALLAYCGQYTSMSQFIRVIQGDAPPGSSPESYEPWPYWGTPTGEAFQQVYDYLSQNGQGINAGLMNRGHAPNDPYYTLVNGQQMAVSCRKTFIIHMTDGNWYANSGSNVDPLPMVWQLHTQNIRPDISGSSGTPITATIYPIFCFNQPTESDYTYSMNSLQWEAMYGAFNALPSCAPSNYPYPETGMISNSATTTFSISQCPTTATPKNNSCCQEWDVSQKVCTANFTSGCKGVPSAFYNASNGYLLQQSLQKILTSITQQNGSSSAVATVAQQNTEGDLIIRGVFQAAAPTSDVADAYRFLWYGHMECYWPNTSGNYTFQLYTGPSDTLCTGIMQSTSKYDCWDVAIPQTYSPAGPWPTPTQRVVYTSKVGTDGVRRLIQVTAGNVVASPTNTTLGPADFLGAGSTDVTGAQNLVNWVLGTEQPTATDPFLFKSRIDMNGKQWVLGDIVYSTPVVVGPPSVSSVPSQTKAIINNQEVGVVQCNPAAEAVNFTQYFLNWIQCDPYNTTSTSGTCNPPPTQCPLNLEGNQLSVKYRDKVVYVGANDGMIHAFLLSVYDSANQTWAIEPNPIYSGDTNSWNSNTTSADKARIQQIGQELWAYVPSNLLDQLQNLAQSTYGCITCGCQHQFMVDLAPAASTVFFDNEYAQNHSKTGYWPWHSVILGGEREGGDTYFAMDVTDPRNPPTLLWEYSVFKDMATTFNLSDAATDLAAACGQYGTNITPSGLSSCQAPTFPSGFWNLNSQHYPCNGCAQNCTGSACATNCQASLQTAWGDSTGAIENQALWQPFINTAYTTVKNLPVSWSKPYVGRVGLPSGMTLWTCPPTSGGYPGQGSSGTFCGPGTTQNPCTTGLSGVRNLAFVGGGSHLYDPNLADLSIFPSNWPQFYIDGFKHALRSPFLLALDIETGQNAFKYVWPAIYGIAKSLFPEQDRGCDSTGQNCATVVPYAMSDPVVLDLWNLGTWTQAGGRQSSAATQGEDGYADSIYVGDMNGVFYGIKLNFDPMENLDSGDGIYVDIWRTKPIPWNTTGAGQYNSDWYRSGRQPLQIQSAASWEPNNTNALRVIIAGGKYENITGNNSDATDLAQMSLYNLRDPINFTTLGAGSAWTGSNVYTTSVPTISSGLNVYVRTNCDSTTFRCIGATDTSTPNPVSSGSYYAADPGSCAWTATGTSGSISESGCTWIQQTGSNPGPDCCDKNNPTCSGSSRDPNGPACWDCIFDLLTPGERVIGKPLIMGGVVFFTSFSPVTSNPNDICQAGGTGYLYALNYMCEAFPSGFVPIGDQVLVSKSFYTTAQGTSSLYGQQVNLGAGIPSQVISNSQGNQVVISNSLAQLQTFAVNTLNPNKIQGWREKSP